MKVKNLKVYVTLNSLQTQVRLRVLLYQQKVFV